MACRLLGTKPLPNQCLNMVSQTLGKKFNEILFKSRTFHSRKFNSTCRMENGGHFGSASVCCYVSRSVHPRTDTSAASIRGSNVNGCENPMQGQCLNVHIKELNMHRYFCIAFYHNTKSWLTLSVCIVLCDGKPPVNQASPPEGPIMQTLVIFLAIWTIWWTNWRLVGDLRLHNASVTSL